jgi:hypothetical protein
MDKFYVSLMSQGNVFDSRWFDNLDDLKEWAKGRSKYYNRHDRKFHKYTVSIYTKAETFELDGELMPYDDYLEE